MGGKVQSKGHSGRERKQTKRERGGAGGGTGHYPDASAQSQKWLLA